LSKIATIKVIAERR